MAFHLVFIIKTVTFCLFIQLSFFLRFGIQTVFFHYSSNLPFADTNSFLLQSDFLLSTAIHLTIFQEDSADRFNKLHSLSLLLLTIGSLADPLIILALLDFKSIAYLSHGIQCTVYEDRFTFHSRGCIKMCRDFFKISTFSFSSASSRSFFFNSFSNSLILFAI